LWPSARRNHKKRGAKFPWIASYSEVLQTSLTTIYTNPSTLTLPTIRRIYLLAFGALDTVGKSSKQRAGE
jgi:hypothetical protein